MKSTSTLNDIVVRESSKTIRSELAYLLTPSVHLLGHSSKTYSLSDLKNSNALWAILNSRANEIKKRVLDKLGTV
jgi:hypothetical protein